ncbi:hypothetical protein L1D14_09215 [Vibrio tubiashii]|uniref:hypothetical protein n=1 Tax=Vibrio tubiashii TaxID=29498 RepID=UPI001EFE6D44|nr:hypothetical protein [Vibrio tubiashii]MCG9576417.1 hypothetical protein [Vibrio tubiashii]
MTGVTYQTVNISNGGGSANLLINPRGKINQANESKGVIVAGQYFCDGWKAGAAGAEVYVDSDGFRLVSGSIIQLVPNNIGEGRTLRANMDKIVGTPVISINGGGDNVASNNDPYIKVEVSGSNTKFSRLILADSTELPIYQQVADELTPCLSMYEVIGGHGDSRYTANTLNSFPFNYQIQFKARKAQPYAATAVGIQTSFSQVVFTIPTQNSEMGCSYGAKTETTGAGPNSYLYFEKIVIDARP